MLRNPSRTTVPCRCWETPCMHFNPSNLDSSILANNPLLKKDTDTFLAFQFCSLYDTDWVAMGDDRPLES